MNAELNNGSGMLFPNDKKGNDKAPDYRGKVKLPDGNEMEISGWVKQGKNTKFLSLQIKERYVKNIGQQQPEQQTDDLPF